MAETEPSASTADWLAVIAGSLGALMATLDISITNAALPQIQGEIGASGTEGTWISTGYLVAEVVVIPLTAWLTRVAGMRNLLLFCATGFTLFSLVCGSSHDLNTMIIGRVGQGLTGGVLIPTAQTIVRTRLPLRQLPKGMAMFGLIILVGPLLGPLVGGWLTENVSWQWCFFVNLPVSFLLLTLLLLGLPKQATHFALLKTADWGGIAGLALMLGSLTVVLEDGQRERWFESGLIAMLSLACLSGLALLMATQVFVREPVVKLRLLLNVNYASVVFMVLITGAVMYSIIYVLPQFLTGIAGYNAEQSGRILFMSGIPAIALMPILPRLLGRVNPKLMVGFGLVCFAGSCFVDLDLSPASTGHDFYVSQLLRGFGQIFTLMPLNQACLGAVAREDSAQAAGLYNMFRNLGGSIGVAMMGIFVDRRTELHADALRESVQANSPLVQDRIAGMAATFLRGGTDPAYAHMQALRELAAQIHRQAMVITYLDCFQVLGIALLSILPLVVMLRMPKLGSNLRSEAH